MKKKKKSRKIRKKFPKTRRKIISRRKKKLKKTNLRRRKTNKSFLKKLDIEDLVGSIKPRFNFKNLLKIIHL